MNVLFLSHYPHEAHLGFAGEIQSKILITPFKKYTDLIKKYHILGVLYPLLSLIYSFSIDFKKGILFVDGGSSLYLAVFLKIRNKKLKIIYLDGDLLFFTLNKSRLFKKKIFMFFLNYIDGAIFVSEQNKKLSSLYLKVPSEVCPPYPKDLENKYVKRENYGLYVGRLDPDKNLKRIIRFGLQCPHFEKFIIVGDGLLRDYVSEMSNKHEKLVYVGRTDNVEDYYNKCKFLVHIPDADPHPCTTMEAALCGCFPLMSKGVGSKYLFPDIFFVNDPNDFNTLNNKISYILKNEKKIGRLLTQSTTKFPTKKQSLKQFKTNFKKIVNKI